MNGKVYSQRLGMIADEQFQAALDRFNLGKFSKAEPVSFGNFGQNVFVSSVEGEFVLRGSPHFWWQFPTEQFFTRLLHERTEIAVPWPYLIDPGTDIFGWSFVLMPCMPGLQLNDPRVKEHLSADDRLSIAHAIGENLAKMQQVTWPISGRYNPVTDAVEPFDLATELAWPFPVLSNKQLAAMPPTVISYSKRVTACLRHHLASSQAHNTAATTREDLLWVELIIADAQDALDDAFEPCLLMEDYKEGNLVVMQHNGKWQVSGVFDLMGAHFGDGEADLARPIGEYLNEDAQLARTFLDAYRAIKPLRPGFINRFPVFMLLDRAILWEFFQRHNLRWWPASWTFRDWAGKYMTPDVIALLTN